MPTIDTGDTAWLLVATSLVMLMIPGLALFYGGMVQAKNVLSTFMHSFFALALVSVQWAVIGYSLVFGQSHSGIIGGFDYALLHNIGLEPKGTVPHLLFVMYQAMFAAITPALIAGAFAERMRFSAFCLFTLGWTTLVYDPVAHWVWAPDGWLLQLGALDFAGGTVVHWISGVSALVAAMIIGRRIGYPASRHQPHNITMTVLGAGLLWFGWFGFNAGSALGANALAAVAFTNTHLAAAAGAVAWGAVEAKRLGKITMLGVASGLVAGLVGITPAAGFVTPVSALIIGAMAGIACYCGVLLKGRFGYDDALDAFGVHGVGGALGALLTGVLATSSVNSASANASLKLFGLQLIGLIVSGLYAAIVSFVLLKVLNATLGLRVTQDEEREGLDSVLHSESGYHLS